jgi:hypothetical protein
VVLMVTVSVNFNKSSEEIKKSFASNLGNQFSEYIFLSSR